MNNFEIVENLDIVSPGRPVSSRGAELEEAITHAAQSSAFGVKVDLSQDEQEEFYRFAQRARAAAKRLGYRINVSVVPGDNTHGNIRVLGEVQK